jgi:TPP-dependent pyruvate/acetoin dehydrogenase alpha subunit
MRAPLTLLQQQPVAIRRRSAQTAAETLADKAAGYRIGCASTAATSPSEATREAVARAQAGGPTFIEAVTYRAAPRDRRRSVRVHRRGARRGEKQREYVGRYEAYLHGSACSPTRPRRLCARATELMREDRARRSRAAAGPVAGLLERSSTACLVRAGLAELRRCSMAELTLVEAINDAFSSS